MFNVANDADDRAPCRVADDAYALAERRLGRPLAARHRLVHDRHRQRAEAIRGLEIATGAERDLQGVEESVARAVELETRAVALRRGWFAFDLVGSAAPVSTERNRGDEGGGFRA